MTAKKVVHTQGTHFYRGTGSPVTYTQIAQIGFVPPPSWKRKALDATTLDQTSTSPEYIGSVLIDYEPLDVELLWDPTSTAQTALEGDKATQDPVPYKVTLRNGDSYAFLGVITSFKLDGKQGEFFKGKATIQISGDVTYTAGP